MGGKRASFPKRLVVVFLFLSLAIVVSGYVLYHFQKRQMIIKSAADLSAVAQLKVGQIAEWRRERLTDAHIRAANPMNVSGIYKITQEPDSIEHKDTMLRYFGIIIKAYDYRDIYLFNAGGQPLLHTDASVSAIAHEQAFVKRHISAKGPVFIDFHSEDNQVHLAVLTPVYAPDKSIMAFLLFQIDPYKHLFPFVQTWPVPSKSAETLLVRREGGEVVFLNELRHLRGTQLRLRLPITRTDVPAVMGALGKEGFVEGVDYRGDPVYAVIKKIPDSPWILVAKVDRDEVFAAYRSRFVLISFFTGLLIISAGIATGYFWRQQQALFFREQYESEAQRRAALIKYETLLAAVPDIIMEVDENKIYRWANKAGFDFFGEDVIGKEAAYYFVGEQTTYETVRPLFEGSEDTIYVESWQRRRDGERRLLAWWCHSMKDSEGKVAGTLSSARDITERVRTDEELKKHREHLEEMVEKRTAELKESYNALTNLVEDLNRKTDELDRANLSLKELDRLKSMFIASTSHELRTPLNSIIGFSSILLNEWVGPLSEEQKKNLSIVLRAGKHLLSLINDVIDVSKIETGKVEPVVEDFDLHDLIAEAASMFGEEANKKGVEFTGHPIHLMMRTDRRRLLQCMVNLLSNAVKFTDKGTITLAARPLDGSAEISVSDTGIGIKEEDFPKIFTAFAHIETHPSVKGTGLGLYLTKKLIEEILKGDIIFTSRHGEGSTFTMTVQTEI